MVKLKVNFIRMVFFELKKRFVIVRRGYKFLKDK